MESIKCFFEDYEQLAYLIDKPYNEPDSFDDSFDQEYEDFRSGLLSQLRDFGVDEYRGRGDYSVGHRTGPTRGVGVVIYNPQLFSERLVDRIKDYVDSFPEDYVVVVSGEHAIGEDFYICITKDLLVRGTAECQDWLKPFGF